MSLAAQQARFMAQVMDEEAANCGDARHRAGMAIYRTGYRARMVEVLEDLYERTREAAGHALFRQAAINHLIAHPAPGWRIEDCGEGFSDTLAELAGDRTDLATLAALEWAMHRAAGAADAVPLTPATFGEACAGFAQTDWQNLRLTFVPGLAVLTASHDLTGFWQGRAPVPECLPGDAALIVWREGEQPTFLQVTAQEGAALHAMQQGHSYGEACALMIAALGEEQGVALAGEALGRWIGEGLVTGLDQ